MASTEPAETPPPILVDETRVSDELICGICLSIPTDIPVMTPCEHIFCRDCLEQAMKLNKCCPNDRRPISSTDVIPLEKGKLLWRMWANIQVKCGNCGVGCPWKGTIVNHKEHTEYCLRVILANNKYDLLANECKKLKKECHLLAAKNAELKEEKDAECSKLKKECNLLAAENAHLKAKTSTFKKFKKERRQLVEEIEKLKEEKKTLKNSLSLLIGAREKNK
ncbi:hypothetical protein HJC23_013789 [Cyclotella cryptica]|uniref:RING-type domain-containing protein n=1 Tax=Cyclotella cryptica TaxID=29204 RepID=A0ABD3PFN3_9STRA